MVSVEAHETKFSAQRRFICPRRIESRGKRQRPEIEEKGARKNNGGGSRIFVLEDKGLPLDREARDVAHREMMVCKGKGRNPVSG